MMVPKGSTFRWSSGTFLTTSTGLMDGSQAITEQLAARGLSVAGSGSGGYGLFPGPASYSANVRTLRAIDDAEARQLVEDAFGQTFTFLGAVTSTWQNLADAVVQGTKDTVAEIKEDAKAGAKAALPITALLTVAAVAIAGAVVVAKVYR